MYQLYTRTGTGGFVVEAAIALSGAPCTRVDVAKANAREPEYLKISPLGQVPALVLADGMAITESAAICILIADDHPESRLAPPIGSAGRAAFLRWMMFMTSVIYPAQLRGYYTDRYTADPDGIDGVKQAALREVDQAFAIIDAGLEGREWLAGDAFSIADVYLLMVAHWHPVEGRPRPEWTNIVALCEKLKAHPVLSELNARHDMW